jgi:hypothetical protein
MHGDYIDAIVRTYSYIAVSNPRFGKLSRNGLKAHCKAMCTERFNTKDEVVLRTFFGAAEGQKAYIRAIERCSADKFRPLVSILNKETANPRSEYVELLAWMFDIQPRPYNDKTDYTKVAIDPPVINPVSTSPEPIITLMPILTTSGGVDNVPIGDGTVSVEKPDRKWKLVGPLLVLLILGLVGYALLSNKGESHPLGKEECMYWAGDHYTPSSCIQRGGDTAVIAMDPIRLRNFKRITDTKTITPHSIGKVWYRVKSGNYEFYTTGGKHPIDVQVNLRRLTDSSYEKFLRTQLP